MAFFPGGSVIKNSLQCQRCGFDSWVRKMPWRRKWQPTPVFSPGTSHGLKSLAGYSSWGRRVGHDLATKQVTSNSLPLVPPGKSLISLCQTLLNQKYFTHISLLCNNGQSYSVLWKFINGNFPFLVQVCVYVCVCVYIYAC